MSSPADFRRLLPIVILLASAGCSPAPTPPAVTGTGSSATAPGKSPETADAAVRAVIEGVQRNHPEALWDFLPPSYQTDVNELMHDFANRMDPDIWSRGLQVVRKVATVLETKKEFLPPLSPPPQRGSGAEAPGGRPIEWEQVATLIRTVADSDAADLEKLKAADARMLIAGTGGEIMKQWDTLSKLVGSSSLTSPLFHLSELRATLESSKGDSAVVLIEMPGEDPKPTPFVRVEGKWIPKDLADGWIEAMGESRARLLLLSADNLAETKPRVMTLLTNLEAALDRVVAAKDAGQFQLAVMAGVAQFAPMFFQLAGPPEVAQPPVEVPSDPTAPRAEQVVTLLVRGDLAGPALEEMTDRLRRALAPAERPLLERVGDDEMTSFKLGPVDEIEDLVKKLDFLEIERVDPKTRTILAKLKR